MPNGVSDIEDSFGDSINCDLDGDVFIRSLALFRFYSSNEVKFVLSLVLGSFISSILGDRKLSFDKLMSECRFTDDSTSLKLKWLGGFIKLFDGEKFKTRLDRLFVILWSLSSSVITSKLD